MEMGEIINNKFSFGFKRILKEEKQKTEEKEEKLKKNAFPQQTNKRNLKHFPHFSSLSLSHSLAFSLSLN